MRIHSVIGAAFKMLTDADNDLSRPLPMHAIEVHRSPGRASHEQLAKLLGHPATFSPRSSLLGIYAHNLDR